MRPTKTRIRLAALVASSALAIASAQAQNASVIGRVTDENVALALGGALVQVVGTNIQTFTNAQGDYSLPNAPAGLQTLRISYLGYQPITVTVEVPSSGAARADAAFATEATYDLDPVRVEGSLVGTARALNRQRAADSLSNIVASDEIGNFPDANAAESLQRIPGVALYRDQGEGRYVVLRGLNYTFTSVELDGSSFAGADLGERATALDVVSSDLLASIEVTKVPTPDMDAEGIAGKVNIKSKSPFDGDVFSAQLGIQTTYSDITDQWSPKINGEVTWLSEDEKWGFLVAPSWQSREYGSHNYEVADAWSLEEGPDGNEYYFAEEIGFREYQIERTRKGLTAAIEFRPDDATKLYLKTNFNQFTDNENRWVTLIPFAQGEITALDDDSATVEDMRRISRRLRQREKDQEVYGALAGFEKRLESWTLDGKLGFSEGKETRPNEISTNFRRSTRDGIFSYSFTHPYDFTVTQTGGASIFDPASYNTLNAVEVANESGKESSLDLAFNARYDFPADNRAYLKFGARARSKEKTSEVEIIEYTDGPASFTFANTVGITTDYPFMKVPRIDPAAHNAAFNGGAGFDSERLLEDSTFDDWKSDEDIAALYAMGGWSAGKANFIAGARYERTDFTTNGFEIDLDEETVAPVRSKHSYDNFLPSLHFRYDASDKLVYRASWSNSLARPSFGDTAFRKAINNEDEEIFVGNPELETLESVNWDASVEYYLDSLGVLSASVFHKDIKNFAYEFEIDGDANADPDYPGYAVTTFQNGSDGKISGLELAYQQQLTFLPAPFEGFGVMANITFLDSEATYPTRPGEKLPFIGQSDQVGNLALTYEAGKFFGRLALNFRSERFREDEPIGGDEFSDLYVDDFQQLDLTLRYNVSENWTVFSEFLNIADEPFRVYLRSPNGPDRNAQVEEYGWSSNVGLRWKY